MADGEVSLNCEGCQEQRRGVHGEELAEHDQGAAQPPPHPPVPQYVIGQHLLDRNISQEQGPI